MSSSENNFHPKRQKLSLKKAQIATRILHEELESGLVILDRIKKQKQYVAQQVMIEVEKQEKIKAKIKDLKREINLLQLNTRNQERQLDDVRKQNMMMDVDLAQIESEVSQQINRRTPTIQNDFSKLIEAVNLTGREYQRQKSVALTCARDLIKTTEQNEFDDFTWMAKVASNKSRFGMRIRFDKLNFSQKDLHQTYIPVIQSISQKFKTYQLEVKTKWRRENSVITGLDITLSLPLRTTNQMRVKEL